VPVHAHQRHGGKRADTDHGGSDICPATVRGGRRSFDIWGWRIYRLCQDGSRGYVLVRFFGVGQVRLVFSFRIDRAGGGEPAIEVGNQGVDIGPPGPGHAAHWQAALLFPPFYGADIARDIGRNVFPPLENVLLRRGHEGLNTRYLCCEPFYSHGDAAAKGLAAV